MSAIFLSYRRDDSSGYAGRLFDNLSDRFGRERVFMDIETLEPGMDFVDGIDRAIESCGAVIAMIGPNWTRALDSEGRNRLEDPNDFIRLEIIAALTRGVRVIPVLVHDANMPLEQELPEPLRPLCRLQAYEIADNRWEFDVSRLAEFLEPLIAEPGDEPPAGRATTTDSDETPDTNGDTTGGSGGRLSAVAVLVAALAGGAWWFTQAPTTPAVPPPDVIVATPSPPGTADRDEIVTAVPVPDEPEPATVVTDVPVRPDSPTADAPPPATEPPPVAPPAPSGPSAEELRQREIVELLRAAEIDISALRLTRPAGNNALERLRRVLELDPQNRSAHEALNEIADRYRGLTEGALQRGTPDDAQRYLDAAASVDPGAGWLVPFQREIDEHRSALNRARAEPGPDPAVRPDRARIEACLSGCERDHGACQTDIKLEYQTKCVAENKDVCNERYEDCMSDGSKMYMGQVALESECAGVHIKCERALAEECAAKAEQAGAHCQTRFDRCTKDCR